MMLRALLALHWAGSLILMLSPVIVNWKEVSFVGARDEGIILFALNWDQLQIFEVTYSEAEIKVSR